MKVVEYRVLNIDGKVILYCKNLKDAVECCHKFNSMYGHGGCKVVKVIARNK